MKKVLGLLIAMMFATSAYASITVTPTKIEINANKLRNNYATTAIEIKGDANHAMRFKAYPGYFTISNESKILTPEAKNDVHNLSSKIRFVPSEFTVPAGKSQKIRVNISNVNALPDGESRAILYIEDVNAKEFNVPNSAGIGAQLVLKTRVGVPVYVDKGKFVKKADVEYFKIIREGNKLLTETKIVSTGNSKVRYNGFVQIVQGKKLIDEYHIEGKVVGNNNYYISKDAIKLDKVKGAGEYTLREVIYYLDENNNRKNIKKDAILKITGEI